MQGVVNVAQGGVEVGLPGGDGVSSGRSGVEGVRDSLVVIADVDSDEVVGEVEDAEHGNIKGSDAVS